MRKSVLTSLAVLLFLVAGRAAAQQAATWAGTWETTYGVMTLTQEGDAVKGHYVFGGDDCPIEGKVEKGKFTFTYQEPGGVTGEGWFELAADGNSFKGKWRQKGETEWSDWEGRRVVAAGRGGFDGVWETTYGRMRLVVDGKDVRGCYAYASESSITGKVEGKKMTFTYKEPEAAGEGWFELAADGKSFTGKWKENGRSNWQDWKGKRVEPVPGRVWLVIIEANWEKDLSEPEYSFGSMLRSFFTRAPEVQVRQRYFSDEASLKRWCREITYLTEPVVVSLSTHGSPQGASAGGKTVGAAALVEGLKNTPNLKLLHFSACEMMKGSFAADVMKGLDRDATFAISGYTTDVDWAGSAVLEFMYFDLILCRHMSPQDAAKQLDKLMPFAGDKKVPGAPFESMGFRIVTPESKK